MAAAMPGAPTAAILGAALALAGLGFGLPSLVVAGLGMAGLAGLAVAWVELALPRQLVRLPCPARVVEDEPFELRVRAAGGYLPPPGGELSDTVLSEPLPIGPGWRGSIDEEVALHGRGRHRLAPTRLEVRDPLGLRVRAIESDDPGELLVLPRIEPVVAAGSGAGGTRASSLAGLESGTAMNQIDARAIELEVDGLRAYRDGSPASRIHWPAVARTGELIERNLVSGADAAPLVVLDSTQPDSPAALDSAVRAAASLCVHLAANGGCAALLPDARRPTEIEPDMRSWPQVHARLALVEPSGAPPTLLRTLRSGEIYLVSARARAGTPAALRGGSGARFLVTPASAWKGAAVFTVAGCVGRRVGRVGRRAVGRAA
jgi:uncharacterized protein (DUF58 family)